MTMTSESIAFYGSIKTKKHRNADGYVNQLIRHRLKPSQQTYCMNCRTLPHTCPMLTKLDFRGADFLSQTIF